ncbi:hypothetical protein DPX16_14047 [Anabarilius grahami]|uniref:Uncharacterized protein n=1 Tax=Anabarilius grahami TaxID=495550 RepID=A0A3N0YA02_ANAGA|nr:hypothetical protein DPX16_14047 [Anabarilius grahami]
MLFSWGVCALCAVQPQFRCTPGVWLNARPPSKARGPMKAQVEDLRKQLKAKSGIIQNLKEEIKTPLFQNAQKKNEWRGAASANYLIMWHIVISYQASEVFTHRILTPCQLVLAGIATLPSSTCAAQATQMPS